MMRNKPGISGIVRRLCLSVIVISGIAVLAGIYGCDDSDHDGNGQQEPAVPELRAISAGQAVELAAYLRRVRVQGDTGEVPSRQLIEDAAEDETGGETPIAWAMINASCEERALVLEYAAASSSFPLPEEPFVMRAQDISAESVQALADNPGIDTATINIAGPLILEATFTDPDGSELTGEPAIFYWAYHKGVVVNVEGTLKVIDLSTGDEPLDIDQWAHCLVDESVECSHMDEDEFIAMKGYWNSMMGAAYIPQDPPERICGYTITPMFTFRWDQTPMDLVDQLKWTPDSMITQTGGFQSLLSMDYGLTLAEEDAPGFTCAYAPHDTDWLCEHRDPPYCGQ